MCVQSSRTQVCTDEFSRLEIFFLRSWSCSNDIQPVTSLITPADCELNSLLVRWNHVALQRNAFSAAIAKQSGSKSPSILHCTNLLHDISRLYFIMTLTRDQRNGQHTSPSIPL